MFIKSINVFWMCQYLLYLIKHFFLFESLNADDEEDVVQPTNISNPGDDTETETENEKYHQRMLILEAEIEKLNKSATESLQQYLKKN